MIRPKVAENSTSSRPWASLYTHCNILAYAKWHAHRCHDSSKADYEKLTKNEQWLNSWKSQPSSKNSWNNPPTDSVQFSLSVMSNSLWHHGLEHRRPPCPSPTPGVYANSYPLSQWCHPTISSSVVPFSSCLLSFPASGSFPMSQSFTSGGQSIGVSASASILPINIQDWFPLGFRESNAYIIVFCFFISFLLFAVIPFVCHLLSKSHGFFPSILNMTWQSSEDIFPMSVYFPWALIHLLCVILS